MKIICSDYDGTLNRGGITEEKLRTIEKWRKEGNLFTVVSGRGKEFFSELKERDIPVDFLLSCNGAVITDKDGKIVSDIKCKEKIGNRLIDFLFASDCPFAAVCSDGFMRIKNPRFPDEEGITREEAGEIPLFNQISTALPSFSDAERVTEKVREKFGEFLNPLQNGTCIDIVPKGMDKAEGIYLLMKKTGASYEDIIAVGDNVNDEAMIKEFRSYAMENGVERIKTLADGIVSGIEQLIERELSL